MSSLQIRQGLEADIPVLLELENAAQIYPWPAKVFHDLFKSQHVRCTVVENERADVVAFALVQQALDEASLLNIVVNPSCQGQGIGRLLLNHLIDHLLHAAVVRHFFLEVRVSNFSAIALYLSCGFVEVGERRDYYVTRSGGKEDALMMALP